MKRALVVDDDPDFLDLVKGVLHKPGYEIALIPDWHRVYEAARVFKPQLVMLDVYLKGVTAGLFAKIYVKPMVEIRWR